MKTVGWSPSIGHVSISIIWWLDFITQFCETNFTGGRFISLLSEFRMNDQLLLNRLKPTKNIPIKDRPGCQCTFAIAIATNKTIDAPERRCHWHILTERKFLRKRIKFSKQMHDVLYTGTTDVTIMLQRFKTDLVVVKQIRHRQRS